MTKSIYDMTSHELIEFERNNSKGSTSDLCTELAVRLFESLKMVESCIVQLEEYSENELVIDDDNNRRYEVSALKAFTAPVT